MRALDGFLQKDHKEHETHCHNVDKLRNAFVKELGAQSPGQINVKELSKPSGPSEAKFLVITNCPSCKTYRPVGSHTLDPTNPCLLLQVQRIGLNPSILTADIIPIRKDRQQNPSWEELHKGRPDIRRLCQHFNVTLAKKNCFNLVLIKGELQCYQGSSRCR